MVRLFGKNIGLTEKKDWIDLFYEAYNLHIKSESYLGNSIIKKNMIAPIMWAINNIDELDSYTNKIISITEKKEYLEKALEYLPEINCDISINMNYYIFMYNACVDGNEILIDVSFANQLSNIQLNDLLAHEMHHYLKKYIGIEEPKKGHSDITRTLFALENEGIADMCSFDSLNYLYEYFGWMEKGILKGVLDSSIDYIEQLNCKLKEKIIDSNETINLYDYIMENQIVHPLGYTMATLIKKHFGIEELKDCVGKPLQFILKFNLAFETHTSKKAFTDGVIEKIHLIYN